MKELANPGYQHHHTHQAIDHGGDARQHGNSLPHDRSDPFRSHPGKIHSSQEADVHTQNDGPCGAVDTGEDKGEDAVSGLGSRGFPGITQQKGEEPDLPDGRDAGNHQIHRDQQHTAHGDQPQDQEDAVDDPFR